MAGVSRPIPPEEPRVIVSHHGAQAFGAVWGRPLMGDPRQPQGTIFDTESPRVTFFSICTGNTSAISRRIASDLLGENLFQPTPLIYQRNKLFCFHGVISKLILILFFKISIERWNDYEDEIQRHYQWYNQNAKTMRYQSKPSEENDISEIVDVHR
jgi:hypothetical protein